MPPIVIDTPATFSSDPATPIGILRMKLNDIDFSNVDGPRSKWSAQFTDEELQALLNDWNGQTDFALAEGLRILATRPAYLVSQIKLLNMEISVGDLSAKLLRAADAIFEGRAKVPWESIYEVDVNDYSARQIMKNSVYRLSI